MGSVYGQNRLLELVELLSVRVVEPVFQDQPLIHQPEAPFNARFLRDTLFIGSIQPCYHSTEDSLSILYHEWFHYEAGKISLFPIQTDSMAVPVQWKTDVVYVYMPDSMEVAHEMFLWKSELPPSNLPDDKMRELLAGPQAIAFRYAPSNLALEEIAAYRAQLKGDHQGIYTLSPEARRAILVRIRQLEHTLFQRQAYEERNGLNPDGSKQKQ